MSMLIGTEADRLYVDTTKGSYFPPYGELVSYLPWLVLKLTSTAWGQSPGVAGTRRYAAN